MIDPALHPAATAKWVNRKGGSPLGPTRHRVQLPEALHKFA